MRVNEPSKSVGPHARGPIGTLEWSRGLISIEVNEPRRRKNDSKLLVSPEELGFHEKVLWKVGTLMPRGYYARSNCTFEDKFSGKGANSNLGNI